MSEELKRNLRRKDTWLRFLHVLLFVVIYSVAEIVLTAVVVFQFGFLLITGARNAHLLAFGERLSRFMFEVLRYFSFNSDERPFPFADWPPPEGAAPPAPQRSGSGGTRTRKKKRSVRKTAASGSAGTQPPSETAEGS